MLFRSGQPAFAGEAPYRPAEEVPPKPESLSDWNEEEGFHVHGSGLVLGESPGSDSDEQPRRDGYRFNLFEAALNGAWLVLTRPGSQAAEGEDAESTHWVAVHVDHAEQVDALLGEAKELGTVFVHGGTSAAVDAELRDDPWYRRDFEAGETKGRGFIIPLGGDGLCTWRGAFAGDSLCLVAAVAMSD